MLTNKGPVSAPNGMPGFSSSRPLAGRWFAGQVQAWHAGLTHFCPRSNPEDIPTAAKPWRAPCRAPRCCATRSSAGCSALATWSSAKQRLNSGSRVGLTQRLGCGEGGGHAHAAQGGAPRSAHLHRQA